MGEAIDSILAQTYRPLEILWWTTVLLMQQPTWRRVMGTGFAACANRMRGRARNHGLSLVRGEFVAFLDADDLWHAEKLARQMACFARRPELNLCITHTQHFWIPELKPEADRLRDHAVSQPLPAYLPQALLARRTAFERVGFFDPTLRSCSDMDWFLHAAEQKVVIEVLPNVLVYRCWHRNNITHSSREFLLQVMKSSLDRRRAHGEGVPLSYNFHISNPCQTSVRR